MYSGRVILKRTKPLFPGFLCDSNVVLGFLGLQKNFTANYLNLSFSQNKGRVYLLKSKIRAEIQTLGFYFR